MWRHRFFRVCIDSATLLCRPLRQDDCDDDAYLYRRPLVGDNGDGVCDDLGDVRDAEDEAEKEEGADKSEEEKSVRTRDGLCRETNFKERTRTQKISPPMLVDTVPQASLPLIQPEHSQIRYGSIAYISNTRQLRLRLQKYRNFTSNADSPEHFHS